MERPTLHRDGTVWLGLAPAATIATYAEQYANPCQVREFARASRRLAKTEAIDADVLAHNAAVMDPELRKMPDAQTRELRALLLRRRQLLVMMVGRAIVARTH